MNALELYQVWAPEGAPWSPWAKPVLFAAEEPVLGAGRVTWRDLVVPARFAPPALAESALVLDLSGPLALKLALVCAARGWRPVPLFNSCTGRSALLDNEPIRAGLVEGAERLRELALPESAAPAFVLDSRRTEPQPTPGCFDNRWVVFAQDFPSGARLLAAGLRRALLIQDGRSQPRPDLAHVLLRWQEAGLVIQGLDLAGDAPLTPIVVAKPSRFRAFGYRALVALGLRKNSAGGFGGIVPTSLPGGGGGGGMWA